VYVESGIKLVNVFVSGVPELFETAFTVVLPLVLTCPPYLNELPGVVYVILYCLIGAVALVIILFVESEYVGG